MEMNVRQKKKIRKIAEKYHLKLILLFGSRANGRIHKESDFDVAYLPKKNLAFDEENYLNFEFTNIFQHDRVDTVDMRKASPLLLYAIFQNPVILFAEDELSFYIRKD